MCAMISTKMLAFRKYKERFSFRRRVPELVIFLIFLSTSESNYVAGYQYYFRERVKYAVKNRRK